MATVTADPVTRTRWMVRRDVARVVDLDRAAGGDWTAEEFSRHLRQRNCVGVVAECGDGVTGLLLYRLHRGALEVVRFAAADAGARAALADRLANRLSAHRRDRLFLSGLSGWATGDVRALARAGELAPLPILADALEEGGAPEWLTAALRADDAAARGLYRAVADELRADGSAPPLRVTLVMDEPAHAWEIRPVRTLREASAVVREWLMGGNPAGEHLGASQTGRECGRVTDLYGREVARVSYNGRVWEPGEWPTPEITDLD